MKLLKLNKNFFNHHVYENIDNYLLFIGDSDFIFFLFELITLFLSRISIKNFYTNDIDSEY
jgi:hypothetical protein